MIEWKMTYKEQLDTIQWKNKSLLIKKRDCNRCVKCGCKTTLQVHHQYYTYGKMAWEYPDECLITLCKKCHSKIHNIETVKGVKNLEFYKLYKFIARKPNLIGNEKILLCMFLSYVEIEKEFNLSNKVLGKLIGISDSSINRTIASLKKKKYINCDNVYNGNNSIEKRIISINIIQDATK